MKNVIEINNIWQAYGDMVAVKGVSFNLQEGQIGCLLGPSGCGKSTVLRAIAGLESVIDGEIIIDGQVASRAGWQVPPERRGISMVFQDFALFPHLSVAGNIAFGLRSMSRKDRLVQVDKFLETVGLSGYGKKYPHELSGGQQQRVALARALAPRPRLVLLDEPFSSLDVALREKLSEEVRAILKEHGTTALMVTHNQNEAFAVSDMVGIISEGKLHQWDTANHLYHRPASQFVADFVGEGVLVKGTVLGTRQVATGLGLLEGTFSYPCSEGCPVDVLIRPDDIIHDDQSPYRAKVVKKVFRGAEDLYTLKLDSGETVLSLVNSHHGHEVGQMVGIRSQVQDIVLFDQPIPVNI